jgi:GNAT superfamily N-acetyltransferase
MPDQGSNLEMARAVIDGQEFLLRPALEEEMEWVLEGMIDCAIETMPAQERPSAHRGTLRSVAELNLQRFGEGEERASEMFLLQGPEGPAGFLWMSTIQDSNTGEITGFILDIYIVPAYRCRGLGGFLMTAAESWTRAKGLKKVFLNVGFENEKGRRLYDRLGYRIATMWMSKEID